MSGAVCPYCRAPIGDETAEQLMCAGCGTLHHSDCYAENGGCTIFGCRCAPPEEPKVAVSGPELMGARLPGVAGAAVAPALAPTLHGNAAQQAAGAASSPTFGTYVSPAAPKRKITFIMLGIF